MIQCLIVEDEPPAQKLLTEHINTLPSLALIGVASNVFEAQELVEKQKPDLIFLDLNLPQVNGLDWLRSLGGQPLNVIITTGDESRGADAFDLNVIHYLRKPITIDKFMLAVNRYRDRTQVLQANPRGLADVQVEQALYLKDGRELVRVPHRSIMYLEAQDGYVKICQEEKKPFLAITTMKLLEGKLPSPPFYRMNRTFIVRHDCVERINGNQLTLCDGQTVLVSETYLGNLKHLREHIGGSE